MMHSNASLLLEFTLPKALEIIQKETKWNLTLKMKSKKIGRKKNFPNIFTSVLVYELKLLS